MISHLFQSNPPISSFQPLDLSKNNTLLTKEIYQDLAQFSAFIQESLGDKKWGMGGYLEDRAIYEVYDNFETSVQDYRSIHLGIDIWAEAGTRVLCPLDGIIHSFQVNAGLGNYGPTIILEHDGLGEKCFSLYGHLAIADLEGLFPGQKILAGQVLAHLGTSAENGSWPPHLHFQWIRDLQGNVGDYPGVCSARDLAFYAHNCPDPMSIKLD
ncbi:peptidoglycan DD-metalloendopeptidase family protein [Aquirufa rosea]|uniref:Peptidase M23 n=1 Tax=Aquirufa rosea TaxID=2509241 RepID=A0A4Q1BZ23_9BACT|nr:peptidoglycan DD-metalloendopeptidase family protein [Aquirufa rosea]RXK48800.1 peptidase M23 [Aquirufa rosea]